MWWLCSPRAAAAAAAATMARVESDRGRCEPTINRKIKSVLAELGDRKLPDIEDRFREPNKSAGKGGDGVFTAAGSKRKQMGMPGKGPIAGGHNAAIGYQTIARLQPIHATKCGENTD